MPLNPPPLGLSQQLGNANSSSNKQLSPTPVTVLPCQKPINRVTVHLDVEYKVAPLARDLGQHQSNNETRHTTSLVRAEVWIEQTNPAAGYTGSVRIQRSNGNVKAYPDANGSGNEIFGNGDHVDIANKYFTGGKHIPFYLMGTTAGEFELDAGLENLSQTHVTYELIGARQSMAVVALALELHRDGASPAPGAMSDQVKVQTGRLLHLQNNQGNCGRAKLVIVKPHANLWSVGDGDYELVVSVDAASGGVEIYSHAQNGAIGNGHPLPIRLRRQDFQNGNVELWVQGAARCNAARDVKIDVGLDRPQGGLSKAVKRNGDWARLTVVEITRVTPTADSYRQYINIPAASSHPEYGRDYPAEAQLAPALPNVNVLFKLVPDGNNKANLPNAQQHQDPNTPVSRTTSHQGLAAADLTLSRYGGDVFRVGAYLQEDATAGASHPVMGKPITVWRKIFYELKFMKRPGSGGGDYGDRADENRFGQELARCFVEIERAGIVGTINFRRDVHFNGAANWAATVFTNPLPERTVMLGFVDSILSPGQIQNVQLAAVAGKQVIVSGPLQGVWIDTSTQASWLVSPHRYRTSAGQWQPLGAAAAGWQNVLGGCQVALNLSSISGTVDVELVFNATNTQNNTLVQQTWTQNGAAGGSTVSSGLLANHTINGQSWFVSARYRSSVAGNWQPIPPQAIQIALFNDDYCLGCDFSNVPGTFDVEVGVGVYPWQGFGGVNSGAGALVAVRYIEAQMPGHEVDNARQIALHEVGHFLGLGSSLLFDGQANPYHYSNPGIGNHCNRGPNTCVMLHAPTGPGTPNTQFCATCEEILRARDMRTPPTSTAVNFPA